MALRNVLIIFDHDKFSKQMIMDDMKSEGFKHFFKFSMDITPDRMLTYIGNTDEVWVFGDVEDVLAYKIAVREGKEIWKMA